MSLKDRREQYPYSRNRVFLSAIIAILSTILALTLFPSDITLGLYYILSTFIVIVITFFLKKHLYPLLTTENIQSDTENETKRTSWKMLLISFFMLIGSLVIPLLLAGFLSGPMWFIMITSFTSGVSISEIVIYQKSRNR